MQILGVPKKMCSRRIRPFVSSFLFTYFDFGPTRRGNESGILSVGKYIRPCVVRTANKPRTYATTPTERQKHAFEPLHENSGEENIFARRLPARNNDKNDVLQCTRYTRAVRDRTLTRLPGRALHDPV